MKNLYTQMNDVSSMPSNAKDVLWSQLFSFIMEQYVTGVSNIKKITMEGLGALSIDLEALT